MAGYFITMLPPLLIAISHASGEMGEKLNTAVVRY